MTGGSVDLAKFSSTEILLAGSPSWKNVAALPSERFGLVGVSVANKFYAIGMK